MEKADRLQAIREVRTIGRLHDERWEAEAEVNEALALGWRLLLVQAGAERPVFVIGWPSEAPPARTAREHQRLLEAVASGDAIVLEVGEPLPGRRER
jgi:hypothetical protein